MGFLSCFRIAPKPVPDASHSITNSLSKFGKANTGAS
ncbi:hypothetical protein A2U01_0084806, partial [Trifolium medium]|nr:hypothetical protein [Trifolium medium]